MPCCNNCAHGAPCASGHLGDLSPEEWNGVLAGLYEAAQQLFPNQVEKIQAWVQQQAQVYVQQRVNQEVVGLTNNPVFWLVVGVVAFKFLTRRERT